MEKLWNWEKKSNQIEQHTEKKERNWFPTVCSLYFKRGTTRMSFVFTSVLDVLKKVFNSIYTCLLIITQKEKERSFMFWLLLFYCLLSYIIDVCANRYRKWAKWVSTKTLFDRILLNLLFFLKDAWNWSKINNFKPDSNNGFLFLDYNKMPMCTFNSPFFISSCMPMQKDRVQKKGKKNKKLNCSFVQTLMKERQTCMRKRNHAVKFFFVQKNKVHKHWMPADHDWNPFLCSAKFKWMNNNNKWYNRKISDCWLFLI